MKKQFNIIDRIVGLALILTLITACGGGGGSGSVSKTPTGVTSSTPSVSSETPSASSETLASSISNTNSSSVNSSSSVNLSSAHSSSKNSLSSSSRRRSSVSSNTSISSSASNSSSSNTGIVVLPIDSNLPPGTCGLSNPAFCETFDQPYAGGKGGDIDETRWSLSRYGHPGGDHMFKFLPRSTPADLEFPATFCGQNFSHLLPSNDVKICSGVGVDGTLSNQLNEVLNDDGDFGYTSMRILQPFDFTGRTGRLVMDVDAKINPMNIGHGWWIEVWITEDPAPMPYHDAPTVLSRPRMGVGFAFQFGSGCTNTLTKWNSLLETVNVIKNYEILHRIVFNEFDTSKCFKVADGKLNHMEFRINQQSVELWASDDQNPDSFQLRAKVEGLDLPFTKGYVHLQHAAYNATKDYPVTDAQTFRWDNIGFDGPTYPVQRLYQAPDNTALDNNVLRTGYLLEEGNTQKVTIPNVNIDDALKTTLSFNLMAADKQSIDYRINGKAWHNFVVPIPNEESFKQTGLRTQSIELDPSELVNGDNDVEFKMHDLLVWEEIIGNIEITVDAQ